jgi:hypothetical protein
MDVEIEQRGRQLVIGLNSQASEVAMVDAPTPPRVPITAVENVRLAVRRPSRCLGAAKTACACDQRIAHLAGRKRLEQVIVNAAGDRSR